MGSDGNITDVKVCWSQSKKRASLTIDYGVIVAGTNINTAAISGSINTVTRAALAQSLGSQLVSVDNVDTPVTVAPLPTSATTAVTTDTDTDTDPLDTDTNDGPAPFTLWWVIIVVVGGAALIGIIVAIVYKVNTKQKYSPKKKGEKRDDIETRLKTVSASGSDNFESTGSSGNSSYTGSSTPGSSMTGTSETGSGSSITGSGSSYTQSGTATGSSYTTDTGSYSTSSS